MLDNMQPSLEQDEAIMALQPKLAELKAFSKALVIRSPEGYQAASKRLTDDIKPAIAEIEAARKRITVPLNAALDETNAQAKAAAAPWKVEEVAIKSALVAYTDEQDRLRREEQRIANEKAEAERRRHQAAADEARRKAEAEARAKREAAEKAAAEGRAAEAAKLAAQAERAEERGAAKAETYTERAASVVAPVSMRAAPAVGGVKTSKVWDFEITDPLQVPREFLIVDETKIRKVIAALKEHASIPGVRIFQKTRIGASAA